MCYLHDVRRDERVLSRRKSGGGARLVWEAVTKCGVSALAVISEWEMLVSTLHKNLLPFTTENFHGVRFVQRDNASIYTAHVARDWLKSYSNQVIKWLATSPDLNPIENI